MSLQVLCRRTCPLVRVAARPCVRDSLCKRCSSVCIALDPGNSCSLQPIALGGAWPCNEKVLEQYPASRASPFAACCAMVSEWPDGTVHPRATPADVDKLLSEYRDIPDGFRSTSWKLQLHAGSALHLRPGVGARRAGASFCRSLPVPLQNKSTGQLSFTSTFLSFAGCIGTKSLARALLLCCCQPFLHPLSCWHTCGWPLLPCISYCFHPLLVLFMLQRASSQVFKKRPLSAVSDAAPVALPLLLLPAASFP